MSGRPFKVHHDYLRRQIERLRAEGLSLKSIAHRFGYSYSRIRQLASNFGLTKRNVLKCKSGVDVETNQN